MKRNVDPALLTRATWRRGKAQQRHQQFQQRAQHVGEGDVSAWLRAVERDDLGDPFESGKVGGAA